MRNKLKDQIKLLEDKSISNLAYIALLRGDFFRVKLLLLNNKSI